MDNKLKHICIAPGKTVRELVGVMAKNKPVDTGVPSGIALVVNKGKLVGIVTDGDVRKGISRGIELDSPVKDIMNSHPLVIRGRQSPRHILAYVSEKTRRGNWDPAHFDKIVIVDDKDEPLDVVTIYELWKASDVRFRQIGIVGLGYVGLTLGLTLADLGFEVRGYDTNPEVVKATLAGEPHFFEQGLPKLLKDHLNNRFQVVDNFEKENGCDVYFVAVGTPIGKNGLPSLSYIAGAATHLGKVIKRGDLVVLRSTVSMGTTRGVMIPHLEKISRMKAGEDFHVAFAPERTIEGRALEELRHLPQVIGGVNHASAELASNVFSFITKSVVLVDSLEEAEMVKLVNNTYRAVTFSYANELSLIAKHWGLDTKRVIEAANFGYERSQVPLPSPGVGGYCLEKDPTIFLESAREKGYEPTLIKYTRALSDTMLDHITEEVIAYLATHNIKPEKAKVCVIGFAFKGTPPTSDVRGSTTYGLIDRLKKKKVKTIFGYDPYVRRSDIDRTAVYLLKPDEGIKQCDVIIIMNNSVHYRDLDMRGMLERITRPILLMDMWSLYPKEEITKLKHVVHYRL